MLVFLLVCLFACVCVSFLSVLVRYGLGQACSNVAVLLQFPIPQAQTPENNVCVCVSRLIGRDGAKVLLSYWDPRPGKSKCEC